MQLMILEAVQEEDIDVLEEGLLTLWCDHAPKVGDLVSLGQDKRWRVLEVNTFTPTNSDLAVNAIYDVLVARTDQPPLAREEWSPRKIRALAGHRDLHLSISEVGGEIVEKRINYRRQLPPIGKPLYDLKPTGTGSQYYARPRPWQVSHYEQYVSQEDAAYGVIYLTFCKTVSMESAATV